MDEYLCEPQSGKLIMQVICKGGGGHLRHAEIDSDEESSDVSGFRHDGWRLGVGAEGKRWVGRC